MAGKLILTSFIFGLSFLATPWAHSAETAPVEASGDDEYGDLFVKMLENGKAIERIIHGQDARLLERLKVGSTLTQADLDFINSVVADARLQRAGEAKGHVYTLEELANYRVYIDSLPAAQRPEELATLEKHLAEVVEAKARAATDSKSLSDLRAVIADMPTHEQNRLHGLVLDQAELLSKALKNEKWWNAFWRNGALGVCSIGLFTVLVGKFRSSSLRNLVMAAGGSVALGGAVLHFFQRDRAELGAEIAEFDRLIALQREDLQTTRAEMEAVKAVPAQDVKAPN